MPNIANDGTPDRCNSKNNKINKSATVLCCIFLLPPYE